MPEFGVGYWQSRNQELLALDARYRAWEETQKRRGMTTAIPPGMTLTLGEQDPEIKGKIVQDSEPLFEPPVPKRHRRPKGTPEGLHVETKTIITVIHRDRLIRPDGDEVFLLKVTEESIAIPWPEGMTALDAIIAWASKGMEKGE